MLRRGHFRFSRIRYFLQRKPTVLNSKAITERLSKAIQFQTLSQEQGNCYYGFQEESDSYPQLHLAIEATA
jgi:23S rRNA G2069 N7-methylase RlmK/C1962 C5-methylase RlmI